MYLLLYLLSFGKEVGSNINKGMNKREVLKLGGFCVWIPPVIQMVALPVHAMTSSGIDVSVVLNLPNYTITITDDKPDFSYTVRRNLDTPMKGSSGAGSNKVVIEGSYPDATHYGGSIQEFYFWVTDSDGNTLNDVIRFDIEG